MLRFIILAVVVSALMGIAHKALYLEEE